MNLLDQFAIEALGFALLHSLWQCLLIGGLFFLLSKTSLKNSPGTLYRIGMTSMVLCFVLFIATFIQLRDASEAYYFSVVPAGEKFLGDDFEENTAALHKPFEILGATRTIMDYSDWLVVAWFLGMLLYSLSYIGSYFFLKNLRNVGAEINRKWQAVTDECAHRLGIKRKVQFRLSQIAEQPLTFGFFKPFILLPVALVNQIKPEEVEAIILHELSHVKRNDYLLNLLQSFIEIVFFFHPAVHLMSRSVRRLREEACDDRVVATGTDPLVYAQALLNTKKFNFSFHHKTQLAMNATGKNADHFSKRIFRILGKKDEPNNMKLGKRPLGILLVCALFSIIFLTSMAFTGNRTLSISADKMNVLYIGVDNPITVAVSEVPDEDITITSPESDLLELKKTGSGKYNIRIKLKDGKFPENVSITAKGKDFEKSSVFRVKRIPDPMAVLFNGKNWKSQGSGTVSQEEFVNDVVGVDVIIPWFDFDAKCELKGYEVTRVPKDISKDDPTRVINKTSAFSGRAKTLIREAKPGDVYYFDNVTCHCPGDPVARKINSMVWQIREE